MARAIYHVVPHTQESGRVWKVEKAGGDKPVRIFLHKEDAVEYGMEIAKHYRLGQLIIHGIDGKIESERTYGEDPKRYPG